MKPPNQTISGAAALVLASYLHGFHSGLSDPLLGRFRSPPSESAAGVRTLALARPSEGWSFLADRGELLFVPADGALGFRVPAGVIFALNEAGEKRARYWSTNRAWRTLAGGLIAGESEVALSRIRSAGAAIATYLAEQLD